MFSKLKAVYKMVVSKKQKLERKKQIISAAALIFAENGFSNTVMADIAIAAGIGKGTIYEYFKSKEDLFFAVFEWFFTKFAQSASADVSKLSGTTADKIKALNDSLMNSWTETKDLFTLVMEFWSASTSSVLKKRFKNAFHNIYKEYRYYVSSLLQDGIDHKEFRTDIKIDSVAACLAGTWDAIFLQAWFDESFDPITVSRDFLDVILKGLAIQK